MTMSATTATTAVVTIAVATTAVASATTSAAGEHVDHTLDFVIGSWTVLYDFARESQVLSCQAVVEVDDDFCFLHFKNQSLEVVAILVHQGYVSTGIDVL